MLMEDLINCTKYLERVIIRQDRPIQSYYDLSLDIYRLSIDNQKKYLRSIFDIPIDIKIHDYIAYLWYDSVVKLDYENIIKYIDFFIDRGCKFCWHHLISIAEASRNPTLVDTYTNVSVNKKLIQSGLPPYILIDDEEHSTGCICSSYGVYSLLEILSKYCEIDWERDIMLDGTLTMGDNMSEYTGILKYLTMIRNRVNELIEWKVPFYTHQRTWYPLCHFTSYLKENVYDLYKKEGSVIYNIDKTELDLLLDEITQTVRREEKKTRNEMIRDHPVNILNKIVPSEVIEHILVKYVYQFSKRRKYKKPERICSDTCNYMCCKPCECKPADECKCENYEEYYYTDTEKD
jgi:hypothetical protein